MDAFFPVAGRGPLSVLGVADVPGDVTQLVSVVGVGAMFEFGFADPIVNVNGPDVLGKWAKLVRADHATNDGVTKQTGSLADRDRAKAITQ